MLYFAIPADYLATRTDILTIKRVVMCAFLKCIMRNALHGKFFALNNNYRAETLYFFFILILA